jgi:hypothetical protein
MGSLVDVVREIGPEHSFEVPTPVNQDVVKALLAHGPDEALRDGIRPRRPDRRADDSNPLGSKHLVERSCELGVPVADEEPDTRQPLLDREVPRLLR